MDEQLATSPQKLSNSQWEDADLQSGRCTTEKENFTPKKQHAGDTRRLSDDSAVLRSPLRNVSNSAFHNSTTPPKSLNRCPDPVTPTANFKMLTAVAASQEYVGNASKSRASSPECKLVKIYGHLDMMLENEGLAQKASRRERSLAFICDRFLALYPQYPDDRHEICVSIDEVAADLGVERRRMYDIVNVLESVDVVRKIAKNKYQYFGRNNLIRSLTVLSEKAVNENIQQHVEKALNPVMQNTSAEAVSHCSEIPHFRREKTLGAISQKFIMLFLASPKLTSLSLQVAAQVLMGAEKIEKETVQFKTKIRRLYDIANIFVSVGLIERDTTYNKQSFKYVGPTVTFLRSLSSQIQGDKNSLKTFYPKYDNCFEKWDPAPPREVSMSPLPRTKSECWSSQPRKKAKTMVRHLSLYDICAAAEVEREKLYTSSSIPSSPINFELSNSRSPIHMDADSLSPGFLEKSLFPDFAMPSKQVASDLPLSSPVQNLVMGNPPKLHKAPHLLKLVKRDTSIESSQPKNSETKPDLKKVISLTPEQKSNILKFLDVSLQDGQVATIHISNGRNEVDVEGSFPTQKKNCTDSLISQSDTVLKNDSLPPSERLVYREQAPLLESDSNTSNSCFNDTCSSVSSGYNSSSFCNGSCTPNNTILCNHEGLKTLNMVEMTINDSRNVSSHQSSSTIDRTVPNHFSFLEENSNSNDSTSEEIQAIMKQNSIPVGSATNKDSICLFDEKTVSSPLTVYGVMPQQPQRSSHSPIQLPNKHISTPLISQTNNLSKGTNAILLVPVHPPVISNGVTYLQSPIPMHNMLPIQCSSGLRVKPAERGYSPVTTVTMFKQPKRIVPKKLPMTCNEKQNSF